MVKKKSGMTPRQRRKQRRKEDDDLLKSVQSGMDVDDLYPENELEPIEKDESDLPADLEQLLEESTEMVEVEEVAPIVEEKEIVPEPEVDEDEIMEEKEVEEIEEPEPSLDILEIVGELPELKGADVEGFDYDLASIEVLQRLDSPNIGEKLSDVFTKAVLTSSARSSLKDSDFALVVKRDGKTIRKYPIHDKAHVRNALARAAQMIKRGGEAAKDARAALPKIRAAAKKLGIGTPSKKNNNAIIVHKEDDGEYRFVGWLSGKWIDSEKDIISEEAHLDFVNFLKDNEDWEITFRSWHMPGTDREYPIDFWTYEHGFVIVSGKLNKLEAVSLMKAMSKQRIGMSHGFMGIRDFTDSRVIRKYRTFEVSDLPLDKAAFPWSDLTTLLEAKSMKTQLQYLSEVVGEDRLKDIIADTELKKHILESTGIEEKQLDAFVAGEEIVEEPKEEVKEVDQEVEDTPELTPEMVSVLKTSLGLEEFDLTEIKETIEKANATMAILPALAEQVSSLSKQLVESEKDSADKLADFLSAGVQKKADLEKARASQSDDNLASKEEIEKTMPKHDNSWLAELAGVEPATSQ